MSGLSKERFLGIYHYDECRHHWQRKASEKGGAVPGLGKEDKMGTKNRIPKLSRDDLLERTKAMVHVVFSRDFDTFRHEIE
jgi:hypothetical protein